jgi:general secretion pathway protein G
MASSSRSVPHSRRARRAFTLLEVIVVVTIIALLAALVAPKVLSNIGRSKVRICTAETKSIAQQISLYLVDNGLDRLPDDFDLVTLTEGTDPYLKEKDLLDPWDTPYFLEVDGKEFIVWSYGADGEPGGENEDADISSE